jgi:pentatricopeptide repeat protein
LAGRNVLFIGYSFSDTFDITPALQVAARDGARFYWACRDGDSPAGLPVPIVATVPHDLSDARRNLLRCLVPRASTGYADPVGFDGGAQLSVARGGVDATQAEAQLPAASKLAAFGALSYWLELGEEAIDYFTVSSLCPGSEVDRHLLARAYSRARRFRAAVRLFDLMLAEDLPPDKADRAKKTIDWCVGAGFCSATGGRPMRAAHYYRRAREAFNRAKQHGLLDERSIGPGLADQLLRSQAAQEVRLARWHKGWDRERHLVRAARYLDRLEAIGGLELATRPLVVLDRARFELARGDRAALVLLGRAYDRIDPLRDPHVLSVCRRLMAIASRDRPAQANLAAEAWTDGRRIEWAKIQAERLGFDGYSRAPALTYAARSLLLASWDLAKDLLRPRRR